MAPITWSSRSPVRRRRAGRKGRSRTKWGSCGERFFTPRLRFKSYDELNAWLTDKCIAYAKAHPHPELTGQTIWLKEIAAWRRETGAKYHHTLKPLAVANRAGKTVVTTEMTGDFPGSPVTVDFVFQLDGNKIASLEIAP